MDSSILGARGRLRYYTRCYFNVRSKAGISQLNLYTARNQKLKSGKKEDLKGRRQYRAAGASRSSDAACCQITFDTCSLFRVQFFPPSMTI